MANTIALKRRIGSVKNTKQITKAMELVSASKMRRAQDHAIKSRDFQKLARKLLTRLAELTDVSQHPLYVTRKIKSRLYVVITSDRGLAGAYNSNVLRRFTETIKADQAEGIATQVILVGKQGSRIISRLNDIEVVGAYTNFPDQPSANDIQPILETCTQKYRDKSVDEVRVLFTDYKSSIVQTVMLERLLPAVFEEVEIEKDLEDAVVEPSPKVVLEEITERLIEVQLSQMLSESLASEQSSRMIAMKNATDNASGLIDDLTLAYNTARQAAITQELAEITGGAEAMK